MWQTFVICVLLLWDICMLIYGIRLYRREKSRHARPGVLRNGRHACSACVACPILLLFFIAFTAYCRNQSVFFLQFAVFTCVMLVLSLLVIIETSHDPISYDEDSFTFYSLFGRPHTYFYTDLLALRSWTAPRTGTVYELYLPGRVLTTEHHSSPDMDCFIRSLRIQYRKLHNGDDLPTLPANRPAPPPWDPFLGNLPRPKQFLLTVLLINLLLLGMPPLLGHIPDSGSEPVTLQLTVDRYAESNGNLILWTYTHIDPHTQYTIYDFRTYMDVIPGWVDGGYGPLTFEIDTVRSSKRDRYCRITRMEGLNGTVYLSTERSEQQRQASERKTLQIAMLVTAIGALLIDAMFFIQTLVIRHPERYSPRMRRLLLPPDCIWQECVSAMEMSPNE